ncbi:MAG TPA: hypothetical protein VD791_05000 [Burkholderiales bacterium]|nr:hypothetical protein [Burkholderiales bacterium]
MLVKGRPVGILLLGLWCAAHTVPFGLLAADASGGKAFLAWVAVIVALLAAAGLLIRSRIAHWVVVLQVGVHVFVFSVAAWAFLFVALAWGLHASETAVVALIFAYLSFTCWALLYLFYPDVLDYFEESRSFFRPASHDGL